MDRLPCILTIAGSDSGGGAGIQADIKAITMLGGYAASVITALTAQNTKAVTSIHAPSAKFVAKQLVTVLDDIEVDAAKTGMLFSAAIIKELAPVLAKKTFPLVVDPVCVATSGTKLLKDDALDALIEHIFPLADLLTPNIPEAQLFTGIEIKGRDDVFKAAEKLLAMGPKAVLIKGGHSDSFAVTDWFVTPGAQPMPFMQQRVDTKNTHGTGCTLSAAIAVGLGQGLNMGAAILKAQDYLNLALRAGYRLGEGGGPPNHLAPWFKEQARNDVLAQVDEIGRRLIAASGFKVMLPLGRANIAVALPYADNVSEVAGFSGGFIVSSRDHVSVVGYPEFGASLRSASVLLAVNRLQGQFGACMALGSTPVIKLALEKAGAEVIWMDRDGMPESMRDENGSFEEWGAFEAYKSCTNPEAVHAVGDPGAIGRESVIYILAEDTEALMERMHEIADVLTADVDSL
ncbi:bifunctional hydroxymethylpyrimidine kinase/phosphomethylpyrimidine kinase [Pseudodesulfovibrio sediminis]|uniref:hydroxymethylpyrimidine kinase n=1 Tax=Pseudodesulfovibrio sediminis TaxID=2810563 RepID=A0ABM7P2E1_9BACT|nr:bifunctional hydroxymethylpyrimidine kinase/phosphomethylpyrimidine kinase [Pseudodesulfovibrio sediminis]BCS86947.1 hypothetical protein PSDVSF_01890 [Pseudodesulfovibrio sediminis]